MTEELLDARTPAEAKRHWMIDRLWTGQLFQFVALSFLMGFIAFGPWPESQSADRLRWLAYLAIGCLAQQSFVIWAFSLGGPVGRWKARWGERELTAEDDRTAGRAAYDGAPR